MASSSSPRLSRLLNLVALLSETATPLTAREIRERIDADYGDNDAAFRRTFERDKQELRALGIELTMEEVLRGEVPEMGYRVPSSQYALRLPDLTVEELSALQLAASLVRIEGTEGASALWKLGAAGADDTGEGLAALPAHPQLGTLFTAVAERRTVRFRYRDAERHVEPYRLDFARGRWYLRAFDRDRGEERWFRLDRMAGEPVPGPRNSFEVPEAPAADSVPDPWGIGDGAPQRARLTVDASHAVLVRSVLGEEAVVDERPDGGVVVELDVTHPDGFRSFVLGFGDHAEVLGPAELRADMVRWLEVVAEGAG